MKVEDLSHLDSVMMMNEFTKFFICLSSHIPFCLMFFTSNRFLFSSFLCFMVLPYSFVSCFCLIVLSYVACTIVF